MDDKKAKLDRIRGYLASEVPADSVRKLYEARVKGIVCRCHRLNLKEAMAMEVVEAIVILSDMDENVFREMCALSGAM